MTRALAPLIAVAHQHAILEGPAGDLDALMRTMEGEPIYDFYPMGMRFQGMAETRRYYEYYFADFGKRIVGARPISETIGQDGLIGEYDLWVVHEGDSESTKHRIATMLTFGEKGITGERMFSDDRLFRTMLGPLWEILEPIG